MQAIAEPKAAAASEAESKISSPDSPNGAAPAGGPPAAPAAKGAGLSLAQRITAMGSAFQGRGPDADLVALKAENTKLAAEVSELTAEKAKLSADLATAKTELEAAQAAQTDFEAKVNAKAVRKSVETASAALCPVEQLSQIAEGATTEAAPMTDAQLDAAMKGKTAAEGVEMVRTQRALRARAARRH